MVLFIGSDAHLCCESELRKARRARLTQRIVNANQFTEPLSPSPLARLSHIQSVDKTCPTEESRRLWLPSGSFRYDRTCFDNALRHGRGFTCATRCAMLCIREDACEQATWIHLQRGCTKIYYYMLYLFQYIYNWDEKWEEEKQASLINFSKIEKNFASMQI